MPEPAERHARLDARSPCRQKRHSAGKGDRPSETSNQARVDPGRLCLKYPPTAPPEAALVPEGLVGQWLGALQVRQQPGEDLLDGLPQHPQTALDGHRGGAALLLEQQTLGPWSSSAETTRGGATLSCTLLVASTVHRPSRYVRWVSFGGPGAV